MKFSFTLDRMPGRGSATVLATARKSAAGAYRALVRVAPRGGLWLSFSKERHGGPAGSVGRTVVVPGWRYAAGQTVNVHFEAIDAGCHAAAAEGLAGRHGRAGPLAAGER